MAQTKRKKAAQPRARKKPGDLAARRAGSVKGGTIDPEAMAVRIKTLGVTAQVVGGVASITNVAGAAGQFGAPPAGSTPGGTAAKQVSKG